MERLVWFGMRQDWSADAEVKGYTLTPSPVAYSFRNDVSYRRSGFAAAFLPESIPKTGIKCTISYNDGRRASFTFDAKGRVVSDPTLAKRLAIRRVEISEILQPGHKNPSPSLSPTRGEENLPFPRREAVGG
ncbi:MAG: hypothetical protein HPY54_08580 [Chthonomonadetes bacterium]|nr:hypothetical protein [Chthonomonadetes bacterium]